MKNHASEGLTCWDVTGRASEYLDDHLPGLAKVRVDLHLASCVYCRTYVKQIHLVSSAVRSLAKLDPLPVSRLRLRRQFAAHHGQSAFGN
jgi:predicted anti-sigma-YlaC factor YlaD